MLDLPMIPKTELANEVLMKKCNDIKREHYKKHLKLSVWLKVTPLN